MTLKLSPSRVLKYDDCPAAYRFQYVAGLKPLESSASLVFGSAVDTALTGYLLARVAGSAFDPVAAFRNTWRQATETQAIRYSSTLGPEDLAGMGEVLCRRFPAVWGETGLVPLLDEQGPVVQRRFETEVAAGIVLVGIPDVVAMTGDGEVVVVDIKTASHPAPEGFVESSDQLTAYQLLVESHAEALGLEQVAALGFMELLKRKPTGRKGPEVWPPVLVARRESAALEVFRQKLL